MSGIQQRSTPDTEELIKGLYVRYVNLAKVIRDLPVEEELNAFITDRKNMVSRSRLPPKESGQSKYCEFIKECAKKLDKMYNDMVEINNVATKIQENLPEGTSNHLLNRIVEDTKPGRSGMMTTYMNPDQVTRGGKTEEKSELAEALHVLANQNISNFNGTSVGNIYQIEEELNSMIKCIERCIFATVMFAGDYGKDQLPNNFRSFQDRGQGVKEQRKEALTASYINIKDNVNDLKKLASSALNLPETELDTILKTRLKSLTDTVNEAFSTVEQYRIYGDKQSSENHKSLCKRLKEKLLEITVQDTQELWIKTDESSREEKIKESIEQYVTEVEPMIKPERMDKSTTEVIDELKQQKPNLRSAVKELKDAVKGMTPDEDISCLRDKAKLLWSQRTLGNIALLHGLFAERNFLEPPKHTKAQAKLYAAVYDLDDNTTYISYKNELVDYVSKGGELGIDYEAVKNALDAIPGLSGQAETDLGAVPTTWWNAFSGSKSEPESGPKPTGGK